MSITPRRLQATVLAVLVAAAPAFVATAASGAARSSPAGVGKEAGSRAMYVTSAGAGTVSALSIGPGGRLTPLGEPAPAVPEVRGVVLTPDGRFAYAAGLGDGTITAYTVRPSGELARLDEPVPAGARPFGMAMAPSGRALYATAPLDNKVLAFAIGADGRLSPLGPLPSGGTNPRGLAVAPDGRHVYVNNGTRDLEIENTLVTFRVRENGALTPAGRSIGLGKGTFASQIAITPDGRLLYTATQVGNAVWGFRVGPDGDLSPVPGQRFPAPNAPEGLAMTPDGRNLYTAHVHGELNPDGANAVGVFGVRSDGGLDQIQRPVVEGSSPVAPAVSPDGRHLVVSNGESSDVSSYIITGPAGRLRTVPGSPFQADLDSPGFQSVTIAPNQGPTARFSATPRPGHSRVITYDARASTDPDGHIARYDWDFGDGTARRDGGPTPAHHYPQAGTFTVRLTVTDNENCADRLVFTGMSALCNGTTAANHQLTVIINP